MNDVMNCIEDMTIAREPSPEPPREPPSVWSPEAFDELYANNLRKTQRPHTSIEHRSGNGYRPDAGSRLEHSDSFRSNASNEQPSNVGSYVQRMEERLRQLHEQDGTQPGQTTMTHERDDSCPPEPPPKNAGYDSRPKSSLSIRSGKGSKRGLRHVKSGYDFGKQAVNRTFTLNSTSTQATNSSSSTNHTLMSGTSAGGFSATSAGSFYRRNWSRSGEKRPTSVMHIRPGANSAFASRPTTPMTGITYHSSHGSNVQAPDTPASSAPPGFYESSAISDNAGVFGGLTTPKAKKSGFFKKMIDSAKTGAATARSTISNSGSRPGSPTKMTGFAGGLAVQSISSRPQSAAAIQRPQSAHASIARDMGLGGGVDWVQVRRDVNRSNSVSKNERTDRAERCLMLDMVVMQPTDELYAAAEGDEGLDGLPISDPTDFQSCNLQLVDKSARFVNNVPGATTVAALVQGHLCRPYRSDVQRLRAIFTWVSERIGWEEDFEIEEHGYVDTRRVISQHRGCSQEIAYLVAEMCGAVGIHAEIVRGYLKTPGEPIEFDNAARPNHWWNAVIVDGEWRIMDTALANPTHTKRKFISTAGATSAEGWYFLTRPMEVCYTHVPLLPEQQHIVPPVAFEILMALPPATPTYFRNGLAMADYCTSVLHLENLEMAQIQIAVPEDVECVAETEVRAFARDHDGDFFESGDVLRKPALAQTEWIGGRKMFTIKALLPGDEGQGVLKIYAGKRGLMVSDSTYYSDVGIKLTLTLAFH
jgi:bifunctional glutamyl/prolyl-tRNA synthetase